MRFAILFTNFGPYHLARLRGLAALLGKEGGELIAYEVAGTERLYPWLVARREEPFEWITLFPARALESLTPAECGRAARRALERDNPDAVGIVGYARPESMAALAWARGTGRPAVLMSESQRIDRARVWWKEAIKARRVRRFSAALVGGPRHRDYLVELGMPPERIALGYNAVDNARYATEAALALRASAARRGLPERPFFLSVSRFAAEKNLTRLVRAFAAYRESVDPSAAWDLVLCGDGPATREVEGEIARSRVGHAIHRPGFLQIEELPRWYAFASAFVLPSLSEPWGLVVNEAAACGVPLLVSEAAGCVETLVPGPDGTTGRRFDPMDEEAMAEALRWMATRPESERAAMGARASEVVAAWGPDRFARGTIEALGMAERASRTIPRERVA